MPNKKCQIKLEYCGMNALNWEVTNLICHLKDRICQTLTSAESPSHQTQWSIHRHQLGRLVCRPLSYLRGDGLIATGTCAFFWSASDPSDISSDLVFRSGWTFFLRLCVFFLFPALCFSPRAVFLAGVQISLPSSHHWFWLWVCCWQVQSRSVHRLHSRSHSRPFSKMPWLPFMTHQDLSMPGEPHLTRNFVVVWCFVFVYYLCICAFIHLFICLFFYHVGTSGHCSKNLISSILDFIFLATAKVPKEELGGQALSYFWVVCPECV